MTSDDGTPRPSAELRKITDARTLRALAHPVRIALLEALVLEGPMTATEVGARIGESPTTCSFHLRQLAKYQFVEEAGGGKGRARPWRVSLIGMEFSSSPDDPDVALASNALARLLRDRQLERYHTWLETKASYPAPWRRAAGDSEYVFYLTVEELEALNEQLVSLLWPMCQERLADPSRRPAGSVAVEMLIHSYPIFMPAEEE